jgi:hypothetical protein
VDENLLGLEPFGRGDEVVPVVAGRFVGQFFVVLAQHCSMSPDQLDSGQRWPELKKETTARSASLIEDKLQGLTEDGDAGDLSRFQSKAAARAAPSPHFRPIATP